MAKYVVEFIGTFFLVLTVGMTVIGTASGVIPHAGDRLGADGHDLRRGTHLGRTLQPGRDSGRLDPGELPAD